MKKITIENQEVINRLEALNYEVNSRKDLLSYLIQQGVKPTEPAFQAYHQEFQDFFVQYETAKAGLEQAYVKPLGDGLSWSLDFASHELTIQGVDR